MNHQSYVIVVGIDFSSMADQALQQGLVLASKQGHSELHTLFVMPAPNLNVPQAFPVYAADETATLASATDHLSRHVQQQVDQFKATHPEATLPTSIISHVSLDTAAHGIAQLAFDLETDLIVIGTHNRKGVARILLGSVAEATVRHAHCPVLVVPPKTEAKEHIQFAPPCPDCVQTRLQTDGREFWCASHRERHGRRHTYHQSDRSGAGTNFPLVSK